jgi:hypothetical protein
LAPRNGLPGFGSLTAALFEYLDDAMQLSSSSSAAEDARKIEVHSSEALAEAGTR